MGCDAPPEYYARPKGAHVTITVKTSAEAERIFQALAVTDRFGTPWMVTTEQRPD